MVPGTVFGLGATPTDVQWANLLAAYEWVNAHPLAADASPDTVNARSLVLAALVAAQTKLQAAGTGGSADPTYQAAMRRYQAFRAQMQAQETPSDFMLWLSNLPDTIRKLLPLAALGLGAYLLLPVLTRRRT